MSELMTDNNISNSNNRKGCCKAKQPEDVRAMTHEQRVLLAKKYRSQGTGMIVSAIGTFGGLTGGLWNSMGPGAIGVGVGAAAGLVHAGVSMYRKSKWILAEDEAIEREGQLPA
eukprot:GDKH01008769.1.p2 GENE.GDKH01008769.1~~GDKH01008769.1.p2  ORF type:complete len:114 (-),score=22.84 GDKH01008769.1:515-856(-)